MTELLAAVPGFFMGASLIIAIGSQNAYLLRQGLVQPARVMLVLVAICAGADALLIFLGVTGMGVVFSQFPVIIDLFRYGGAAFLLTYAVFAARRALRVEVLEVSTDGQRTRLGVAALAIAGFTFLNPHVYLDTVLLLGSIANQQPEELRAWWTAGAMISSFVWFSSLGFGARLLRPLFARAITWRILDGAIALIMTLIAVSLLFMDTGK